jgi:hypothetical protein
MADSSSPKDAQVSGNQVGNLVLEAKIELLKSMIKRQKKYMGLGGSDGPDVQRELQATLDWFEQELWGLEQDKGNDLRLDDAQSQEQDTVTSPAQPGDNKALNTQQVNSRFGGGDDE